MAYTCDIRTGTCGFSYRDWRGVFYPESLPPADYLSWYAQRFSFVEIDYTYYRCPEPADSENLCAKVPDDFLFSIKATGRLTHQRSEDWSEEARKFILGISPYRESGKLGAVLAQFPYSFHYTPENRTYLANFCDSMTDIPLFIEFRNSEWQSRRVHEGLTTRGVHLVQPDLPDLKGLPAENVPVIGGIGYIRFHGRNRDNWWTGDNVSRYDYLYSDKELSQWAEKILSMAGTTKRLFLAFNNHHKGQAVKNAFTLQRTLDGMDVS